MRTKKTDKEAKEGTHKERRKERKKERKTEKRGKEGKNEEQKGKRERRKNKQPAKAKESARCTWACPVFGDALNWWVLLLASKHGYAQKRQTQIGVTLEKKANFTRLNEFGKPFPTNSRELLAATC